MVEEHNNGARDVARQLDEVRVVAYLPDGYSLVPIEVSGRAKEQRLA